MHMNNFLCAGLDKPVLPAPVLLPVQDILLPDTVSPRTLKEGVVEKKGHSVAFLMWPELVPLNIFSYMYVLASKWIWM